MQAARLEGEIKGHPRAQQVCLSDDLAQMRWTQSFGKRDRRRGRYRSLGVSEQVVTQ